MEAAVGWGLNLPAHSLHSFLLFTIPVAGRGPSVPAQPLRMAGLPLPAAGLRAARRFAVPQFHTYLLSAHGEPERASLPPPRPPHPPPPPPTTLPATHPFPARPACRLRDSRRRSPGPAGAATEAPPHGWLRHRPPWRLQGQRRVAAAEAKPEPAGRVGRAGQGRRGALGGLGSGSLRLSFHCLGSPPPPQGRDPVCLHVPGTLLHPGAPSPSSHDLHPLRAEAASQSGISTPGGAPGPHRSL